MKRSELFDLVRLYSKRKWGDDELQILLPVAEARIGRDLKSIYNLETAQNVETTSRGEEVDSYIDLPSDFRHLNQATQVNYPVTYRLVSGNQFKRLVNELADAAVCTISNRTTRSLDVLRLFLYPQVPREDPNDATSGLMQLWYWRQPLALDEAPGAAHAASVHPDVYIQAMLMEVARIKADDAMKEHATAEYATAIDLANETSKIQEIGHDESNVLELDLIGG